MGDSAKGILGRYARNRYSRGYDSNSALRGLFMGNRSIAEAVQIAGMPEAYRAVLEFMPNLAEARRDEIINQPWKTSETQAGSGNAYYNYFADAYARYSKSLRGLKGKLSEKYRPAVEKFFAMLRAIYQGTKNAATNAIYERRKGTNLEARVLSFPKIASGTGIIYLKRQAYARTLPPQYKTTKPSSSIDNTVERAA